MRPAARIEKPFRVYIGLVPTGYLDTRAINQVIRDGLLFCGVRSRLESGASIRKVVLKPSVVLSGTSASSNAYTHPEVVRAAITQFFASAPGSRITIVEKAMQGYSTARVLRKAHGNSDVFRSRGYYELEHLFPARVFLSPAEHSRSCRYLLGKESRLTASDTAALEYAAESDEHVALEDMWRKRLCSEVTASRHFRDADWLVAMPKLKTDATSDGFSGAVHLASAHDSYGLLNDHRICDSLEVFFPQLVIGDAIVAAVGGHRATERGHELGALLIANNPVAHDLIAAQILNLNPERILHLKMAIERGWGPSHHSQIEIGGAGAEGLLQLSQKTRFWDLGAMRLEQFAEKFEADNPGLKFPVELLSGAPYEKAGAHGAVLDWLCFAQDTISNHRWIARWPKVTICVGGLISSPRNRLVFAVGRNAVQALERITSISKPLLRIGNVSLKRVQLKNERKHLLIEIDGQPAFSDLTTAFALGSLGRMTTHLPIFRRALTAILLKLVGRWRVAAGTPDSVAITSRMPHNRWWALPPRESLKAAAAPEAFVR